MAEVGIVEIMLGLIGAHSFITYAPIYGPKLIKWMQKKIKKWWTQSKKKLKERVEERKRRREIHERREKI